MGASGMKWEKLLQTVQYQMLHRRNPDILILHLGSNDIDTIKQTKLMQSIMKDITYIHSTFPASVLVWCDILPRLKWRNNKSESPKELNIKRKRINRDAHTVINSLPKGAIVSPKIIWHMSELFHNDGVHLSDMGNLVYIQTLKNSLRQILSS